METLIKRLADADIKVAAVVDDAFDAPTPTTLGDDLDEFWSELEADAKIVQELNNEGIPCANRESFERDGLEALWKKRDKLKEPLLARAVNLFKSQADLLQDPELVVQHLESLKLKPVHRVGTKGDVPEGTQLVFLDYNLETTARQPRQTRRSVVLAKLLAERKAKAPFLVLFSNDPRLARESKRFRKTTKYLGGTFAFLAKEDARNQSQFSVHLSGFGLGHPALHLTQQFFRALQDRVKEVTNKVKGEVMQLDVQDYAFIQRLALQDDGSPLGEYLLEMFGTVLKHELQSGVGVQQARRKLDGLNFERHLPFTGQPSAPVRRIYRALLTEPGVGKAEPHALAGSAKCKDDKGNECPFPPLLMLGDIFAAPDERQVYVVVNPACDLQYSPKNQRRQPNLNLTVHLMRGSLVSLRASFKMGKRMELLEFGNQSWRVLWHPEEVQSIPLGQFLNWQEKSKCERVARLALPYALSLQQHWTAQLGRVGLPVNLPFFDECSFQLYRPVAGNRWKKSGKLIKREAIVARHPRDIVEPMHFTFTRAGRDHLRDQLSASAKAINSTMTQRSKAAERLLENWGFWTDLIEMPQGFKMQDDWVDKSKEAVVFKWHTAPLKKDFTSFQKAALVVVLKQ